MSTTHLAGNYVNIHGRIIQRCLICGEKLCDSKGAQVAITADNPDGQFAAWAIGSWVQQDGNCLSLAGETETPYFDCGDYIPDDCCLALVEEVV